MGNSSNQNLLSVDVVLPVYNEERDLPRTVATLVNYLPEHIPFRWRIVIVDNGSTDATLRVARELADTQSEIIWIHLDQKGRGRALKQAWLDSDADVLTYMDIDLSTDLGYFLPLVNSVITQDYDIAIGSRLAPQSKTRRSIKREMFSRGYNLLIRILFRCRFRDAQCGFKAIKSSAAQSLLPYIRDNQWFFDTELLLTAEKRGFRINEIPVAWQEDPDSRVKVLRTIVQDISGLLRLRFGGIPKIAPFPRSKERDT